MSTEEQHIINYDNIVRNRYGYIYATPFQNEIYSIDSVTFKLLGITPCITIRIRAFSGEKKKKKQLDTYRIIYMISSSHVIGVESDAVNLAQAKTILFMLSV